MRASLYEALGIPPTASEEDVRAALRRLIRKYYAKTRDGQGNVEEALRFINHASRILSDPDRRIRYNGELARSGEPVPAPVPHVAVNAMAATGEGTDVAQPVGDSAPERIALAASPDTGEHLRNVHHPGLTEPVASFGRPGHRDGCAVHAVRRVHRRRHRARHAPRHGGGREAGSGLADVDAARVDARLRHRSQLRLGAAARRGAGAGADAANRHRDPQLAAREERVPRHEPAAGRRELDLPAPHGGAGARENRPDERAATVESAGRAHVRLRVLGHRPGAIAVRAPQRRLRPRAPGLLACPSAGCAGDHHRHVGMRRIAADGIRRHDARQMALRLLRAVLDLRRLCAARNEVPDLAQLQARVPGVVGGHGLRLSR